MSVDWDKPLQTVSGRQARFVSKLNHDPEMLVVITGSDKQESAHYCHKDGRVDDYGDSSRTIINVPAKKVKLERLEYKDNFQSVYDGTRSDLLNNFNRIIDAINELKE